MEHQGNSKHIYWTKDMLDYLHRHFATTINEELAGCVGVSVRTLIRKARELGLRKDPRWLAELFDAHRKEAHVVSRRKGYPGGFKKGEHAYPAGEFRPGHRMTPEQAERHRESMRRWYLQHPAEASAKAVKAQETKRRRREETITNKLNEK